MKSELRKSKGIYLGAFKAIHNGHNIVYQDINGKRDLPGDMCFVDLVNYDYIICTPPCNFWSRANWRREISNYSINTKHLLPYMLEKLNDQDKPFIVENVCNSKLFQKYDLFRFPCFVYIVGNHTYWTNVLLPIYCVDQVKQNKQYISRDLRQGGVNVHNVIELFIRVVESTLL